MKINKIASLLLVTTVVAAFAHTASAQVQISGTAAGGYAVAATTGTVAYTLASTAPNKVLVFGSYVDAAVTASNVLYNGVAATGTVQQDRTFMAYFVNPAASGNFTFTLSGAAANAGYFVYELGNVNTLAGFDTGTGATITTTANNRFVADFVGANNTDGATLAPNTASGSILTLSGVGNGNGATGGGSVGAGFSQGANTGTAGVKTLGWTGFGTGFQQGEVSLALTGLPIPEPGAFTMVLGGVGTLLFFRRRSS